MMEFVRSLLLLFLSLWSHSCRAATITCPTRENLPPNSPVCALISLFQNVSGAPDCSQVTCSFSLVLQGPDFAVGLSSGVISTLRSLDREALQSSDDPVGVDLAVIVLNGPNVYQLAVQILVYDENDDAPTFLSPIESLELKENTAVGSRHFIQGAVDQDAGQNGKITYNIESGNKDGAFKLVVLDSGLLYLTPAKSLDRETTDHYLLNITAHDHGQPPRWGFHLVHVTILDANDHFPTFTQSVYEQQELQENAPPNTVLFKVSAVDPDLGGHGSVSYSITNELRDGQERRFTVDPRSGVIRTTSLAFDYETLKRNYYIFWVFASDNGSASEAPKTSEAEVTVHILDVNDEPPEIEVTFYPGGNIHQYSLWEDAPVGGLLADVLLRDPDRGSARRTNITSRLEGSDDFFAYDPKSGALKLAKSLDYETGKMFHMKLVASDNGDPPLTSEFNFTVSVLDRNDNAPTFDRPSYSGQVAENSPVGEQIVRVQASDKDEDHNAELAYSIVDGSDWFTINSTTGWIEVAQPPDRETAEMVTLAVQVVDGISKPMSSEVNVTIHISDVNDMDPVFNSDVYQFTTAEGEPVGTSVGQVQASDGDFRQNSVVRYELETQSAYFDVHSETGIIKSKTILDYEHQKEYTFVVVAYDGGVTPRRSAASVTVRVEDRNDNAPEFLRSSPVYVITSQLADNVNSLETLTASDPDTGDGGKVSYSMDPFPPSQENDLFNINRETGVVSALHSLVHVPPGNYSYVVRAEDNGGDNGLSSTIKLIIRVDPPGGLRSEETASPLVNSGGDEISSVFIILVAVLVVLIAIFVMIAVIFILHAKGYRVCSRHGGDVEKGKPDLKAIARRSSSRVQFANQDDILEYPVQIEEEEKEPTTERADPDGQNTPDKEEGKSEVFMNSGAEDVNSGRSRKPLQESDEQELQREADEDSDSESTDSGHHTSDSVTTPSSIRNAPAIGDTLHEDGKLTSHV